jgi:two-component system, sensor histidine kinase RegB
MLVLKVASYRRGRDRVVVSVAIPLPCPATMDSARRMGSPRSVPAAATIDHRAEISLDWLIRLRWGAVVGQLLTVGIARALLGAELPLARLLLLISILAASNVILAAAQDRISSTRGVCGAALTLDTLLLSGLLHATGGPYNPFGVLYLVYITLAAVVLGARWTWFLAALSVGCYGLLFLSHVPLEHLDHRGPEMSLHLQGMWAAFTVAAILTAYFVVRLASAIERRDAAMAVMRERAARHERLSSVTTLAAGAAHELGTPLATIAVAAKELERSILTLPPGQADLLMQDAALIRSELDRCRAILNRLGTDSGQMPGEPPVELSVHDLVASVVDLLPRPQRERLDVTVPADRAVVRLPRAAIVQVAHNLVRNALDAADGSVAFSVELRGPDLRVLVNDHGPGMPPEVLARVGEPFFSTKRPGQGLGLGVFIARTLAEQMGGRLSLESIPGQGTSALVEIAGAAPDAA